MGTKNTAFSPTSQTCRRDPSKARPCREDEPEIPHEGHIQQCVLPPPFVVGRTDSAMISSLLLISAATLLAAVGARWLQERERELQSELQRELMQKLRRRAVSANDLLDELSRSGSVRVPRVLTVLSRLEREGCLSGRWQDDALGCPRRVYRSRTDGAADRQCQEAAPVLMDRHG